MDVELTSVMAVAAFPPIETVTPDWNPVPVMVTAVPPADDPKFGVILVTDGAAKVWGAALTSFDNALSTPLFTAANL
jgi:hypothetical protein